MKRNDGFSLIELMVALALASVVALAASTPLIALVRDSTASLRLSQITKDFPVLSREMKRYFSRATGVSFTPNPAAAPGFVLSTEGAIVLETDLRPCDTFDPATSNVPANQTQIRYYCCGERVRNFLALVPDGTMVQINSACQKRRGLSVEMFEKATGTSKAICYEDVDSISVVDMGPNEQLNSTNYWLWFSAVGARLPNGTPHPMYRAVNMNYNATGNSGGLITACQAASLPQ